MEYIRAMVSLDTMKKIEKFSNIISDLKIEAELRSGHRSVDARSLIGIVSLDTKEPVEFVMDYDSTKEKQVRAVLKKFEIQKRK